MTKYFKEIDDGNVSQDLLDKLDEARGIAGIPFIITSAYRTPEHNAEVGGVPNSSHIKGLAVDIRVKDSVTRYKVLHSLISAGFDRIGIANTFIHCDIDPDKASGVIWDYS
jgi:uncharacterized protein YcbK (DUF882 family)